MTEFRVNTGMNYPHPSGALDEKTRRPVEKRVEAGDVIPESDLPARAIAGLVQDGHISPVDAPAEAPAAPEPTAEAAAGPEADASLDEGPRSRRGR